MSVTTAIITSDGRPLDAAYDWLSIDIVKEVNRIPYAELVLLDGYEKPKKFALSNSDFFEPGRKIEIKLSNAEQGAKEATVFKGLVIKHKIELTSDASYLTVELKDAAFKLTKGRKSKVYQDVTDSDIISEMLQQTPDIKATIEATTVQHKEMVQYYCTDWDFMLSRADVNGQLVFVDDGRLTTKKPVLEGTPQYTFEYGSTDIYDFEMEVDASGQTETVKSYAWSIEDQKVSDPKEGAPFPLAQGNLKAEEAAKKIGVQEYPLSSLVSIDEAALQAWADAKKSREGLSFLKGRLQIDGLATIAPGDLIGLEGIGERFDGTTMATAIRHQVGIDGWQTHVQFGLSADWFAQTNQDIIEVPAAGRLPAIQGLQVGIVEAYEDDPDKQFRVKVNIPALNTEEGTIWARLLTTDAGAERGVYFYPEPGDEVAVAFFNNDPREALILGAMHSAVHAPPFETTEDNFDKGIITKEGVMVAFNDENKALKLGNKTEKQLILIDEKEKKIMIDDQLNKNQVVISDKGIQISCEKDLKIETKGALEINAQKDVTIKGQKVDIN